MEGISILSGLATEKRPRSNFRRARRDLFGQRHVSIALVEPTPSEPVAPPPPPPPPTPETPPTPLQAPTSAGDDLPRVGDAVEYGGRLWVVEHVTGRIVAILAPKAGPRGKSRPSFGRPSGERRRVNLAEVRVVARALTLDLFASREATPSL